jgi:hypothetical protein
MLLGHGMKTQWPVSSAPFPLGQMHVPIRISPSMHGGGGGSAEGAAAGAGASSAGATGAGAVEADREPVADAVGETDAEAATAGVGSRTGDPGTTGAEAQARGNPAPEMARASSERIRR